MENEQQSAVPESISAAFMAVPFAKMFNEAFDRLADESAPAQDIGLLERIFADILGNFFLKKPSAAPTPDEIRGAAKPVCPTCQHRENSVCSNSWHLSAAPESQQQGFCAARKALEKIRPLHFTSPFSWSGPPVIPQAVTMTGCDACGGWHEVPNDPNCPVRLIDVALAAPSECDQLRAWIKAANQFMWAHEHNCPRRTGGVCNCGLDSFLSRPKPFVESYKAEVDELRAQLATTVMRYSEQSREMGKLEAQLAAKDALLVEARQDTARLDWLERQMTGQKGNSWPTFDPPSMDPMCDWKWFSGDEGPFETLREAIDAAMPSGEGS